MYCFRENSNFPFSNQKIITLVRSVAYRESDFKLFACKEYIDGNFRSQKAKSDTISCLM